MSRDLNRKTFYNRARDWDRNDYRSHPMPRKRSRSPIVKRRSRSPRKSEKEILDENILSEISKLPEPNELWDNQFQEGFTGNPTAPPPPSFSQEVNIILILLHSRYIAFVIFQKQNPTIKSDMTLLKCA